MKTMFKHYFKPMVSFGFFLSVLLITQASWAQRTWVGGTNGMWNVATNWSPVGVPAGENVTVNTPNAFITIPAGVFSVLKLEITQGTVRLANGATLNISGDLELGPTGQASLQTESSFTTVRFTGSGPASQGVRVAGGGTITLPAVRLANTATGSGISLAGVPNLTNLTILPSDPMITALSFEGTTINHNKIQLIGGTLTFHNDNASVAFISIPQIGAYIEGEGNVVVRNGKYQVNNTAFLSADASWGRLLVDKASLKVEAGGAVFDLGYHRLELGGDLINEAGERALGNTAYLEMNHLSRDQTISGQPLHLAQLRMNKGISGKVTLATTVRFTTVSAFSTVSLEFVTGNSLLEVQGTTNVAGATGTPPNGSLQFATSGTISMVGGTGKIIGEGSVFIQNHATPGIGVDPNALITVFVTSAPGATNFVRIESQNLILENGATGGHTLDLGYSTLQLGANLRYNGFITTTSGMGTIEFVSSRNQVVTNNLTLANAQAKEFSFPPVVVNKTSATATPSTIEFQAGANNTGRANYSVIGGGNNSNPNANAINFASTNVSNLDLGTNVFLTVKAQGTLSVFNTAAANAIPTLNQANASNAIRGENGSGVTFTTTNSLLSNFAILTPTISFSSANLNIGSHKLVLGGDLRTTDLTMNASFITLTDFNSAGVVLNGVRKSTTAAQMITAFITGLPNVEIRNNVTLQGNLNIYSSPVALQNITALNLTAGNLELGSKFLTISGYSPVVNRFGGSIINAADPRGTIFVSGLAGTFMTVGTAVADIDFGAKVNVQVGLNSGISFNSATTKSISFQGDLINNAGIQTIFATTNNVDQKVVFKGTEFATVFNTVVFPRLDVTKNTTTDITGNNARCGGALTLSGAALTLTHFVTIAANTGTVLQVGELPSGKSAIFISGTQSGIDLRNDGGNISLTAGSFITGAGFVSVNGFKTVTSGDLVSYANLAIDQTKGLTLAGTSKLSVGGDLMGGMIDGTGAVRFIGGMFQTVTISSLPGIIVDKCPSGPFMTVTQSQTAATSLRLGSSGLTIESGVFAINNPVFTSGSVIVKADNTNGAGLNFITSFNTAAAQLVFNTATFTTAPLVLEKQGTNAFISIPSVRTEQGGEVRLGNNLSLYGGSDAGFYTSLNMTSGNINTNGKDIYFNGGNYTLAFQTNGSAITGTGNVYITAASFPTTAMTTVVFVTANSNVPFAVPNHLFINGGSVALNGTNLRVGGNLYNNLSHASAFSTVNGHGAFAFPLPAGGATSFGQVQFTNANAFISGTAPGIEVPGLFITGKLTLAMGSANSTLTLTNAHAGTGLANVNNFATVLEFASAGTLDLNNRFLSINTLGVVRAATCENGGTITGGVASGSIRIHGRQDLTAHSYLFMTGTINIPTAGVTVFANQGAAANGAASIPWDNNYIYDLRLGGNLGVFDAAGNDVNAFRNTTGGNIPVAGSALAGQFSKLTFTGSAFATVSNINTLPNIEVAKTAGGVYVEETAGAPNGTVFTGLGTGAFSNACNPNVDALSITNAGNLVLRDGQDFFVFNNTNTNGTTLNQSSTGFITGGRFVIANAFAGAFSSVVSPTFTVRSPEMRFEAADRLFLVGSRDRATGTGATLTLGGNLVNNATIADIFGGSYVTSPDGTVQTALAAGDVYTGYNGGLVFFSAVMAAQNQTVTNATTFPRIQATGFNSGFSTVSSTNAVNWRINGNGGNNVLSLNNSVLYLSQNPQFVSVFNNGTAGIFVQTNGGFISAIATDAQAGATANNNLDRNAVQFFQATNFGSDFWFDETSVILQPNVVVGLQTFTLNLGGSVFGNYPAVGALGNTGFSGTTGLLRFTSSDDAAYTQRYMFGVGQVPAVDFAAPFATVYVTESPASTTLVTGSDRDVLTFTSGYVRLAAPAEATANTLRLTQNAGRIFANVSANMDQPLLTVGEIQIQGTGNNAIYHNDFITVGWMNDGLRKGFRLPVVRVNKTSGEVVLGFGANRGNVFSTSGDIAVTNSLVLTQGNLDLAGHYLQLGTGVSMQENLATPAIIRDSRAGSGNISSNALGGGETGVVFATSVTILNTGSTNLGGTNLVVKNGDTGGNVVVDLARRHNLGDDSADMITAVINRNYSFTTVRSGTLQSGNNSLVSIRYADSENKLGVTDLSVIAFTTTPSQTDEQYSVLGVSTSPANNVTWTNPVFGAMNNSPFTTGYITLGASIINMTTVSAANFVAVVPSPINAGREGTHNPVTSTGFTTAYFKFTHPAVSTSATVTFQLLDTTPVDVSGNPRKRAQYGSDFTFMASSGALDAVPALLAPFTSANTARTAFQMTIQPNTYVTFVSVSVADDDLSEGTEFITVQFTSVTGGGLTLGTFRTVDLHIIDNDVPGFEVATAVATPVTMGIVDTGSPATGVAAVGFLTTSETGSSSRFLVRLQKRPTADVRINVSTSKSQEGLVASFNAAGVLGTHAASAFITFTPTNWNMFQTVEVKGQDDLEFDSGVGSFNSYFLTVSVDGNAANTLAPEYRQPSITDVTYPANLASAFISVRNDDNENKVFVVLGDYIAVPNIVEPTPALNQAQPVLPTNTSFSLRLNVIPTAGRDILLDFNTAFTTASDNRRTITGGNVAGRQGAVLLNSTNWNTPVFVTVSANDNSIDDDDANVFASAFMSVSTGLAVNDFFGVGLGTTTTPPVNFPTPFIPFKVVDNDNVGYESNINALAPSNGAFNVLTARLNETGRRVRGVSYRLLTQPTAPVTIKVNVRSITAVGTFSNAAGLSTDGVAFTTSVTLTFTTADWDDFQTVGLQGVDNNLKDGVRAVLIQTDAWSSTDPKYNGVSVEDYVAYIDDDGAKPTDPVTPTPVTPTNLTKPSGITAQPGSRQVIVTWAPNPETGVSYEVCYWAAGVAERCVTTTATSATITGLQNGVTYRFRVRALPADPTKNNPSEFTAAVEAYPSVVLANGEEDIKSNLTVYPNPSDNTFTLKLSNVNSSRMNVVVTDVTGRQIFTKDFGKVSGEFQADLMMATMPAGIYLLSVDTDNGTYHTRLMLVKNR